MLGAILLFASLVSEALAPYLASGELPGAISVFYDNGREEVDCLGYANVTNRTPMSLDSTFMQCSQTKGFCGVTIAILVEEGRISLDDPVAKYLPEFRTLWVEEKGAGSKEQGVSEDMRVLVKAKNPLLIRNVMNHTGGFKFELPAKSDRIKGGGWSGGMPIRSAAAEAAALPILFEPGRGVRYSNTGIDIGAAVVEVVTGKKWPVFLKERVLDPLGMTETTFKPTEEQLSRMIETYEARAGKPAAWRYENAYEQRPFNDEHVFASAGAGLWTTTRDQLKFYKMLMNLGVGDNGARILKEETVKNLLAVSSRAPHQEGYSLGLKAPRAQDDGENAWFGHGGAFGTVCMVNWRRKMLKLWVVQFKGKPRPWEGAMAAAAREFFKVPLDEEAEKAYTGRVK